MFYVRTVQKLFEAGRVVTHAMQGISGILYFLVYNVNDKLGLFASCSAARKWSGDVDALGTRT